MRKEFDRTYSARLLFAILPDPDVATLLIRRASRLIPADKFDALKWGVHLRSTDGMKDPEDELGTFATWTLEGSPSCLSLIITRLRATYETFSHLMACIFGAARQADATTVEVWNLPPGFADDAYRLGGKPSERVELLDAVKWYGPERNEDVEWMYNERQVVCHDHHSFSKLSVRRYACDWTRVSMVSVESEPIDGSACHTTPMKHLLSVPHRLHCRPE